MNPPPSVSVVLPTLNAAPWLPALFARLAEQQPAPPVEILLVDSGSTDDTVRLAAAAAPLVRRLAIERFTHGAARNLGIRAARGEIVALLTQDALPADANWLARLIEPLADPAVAGVYARQIPRADAPIMEQFFLADRFPAASGPVPRRHIGAAPPVYPATFFSNVSSTARRADWLAFPFDETLLMSEDQQFARDALAAGRTIVYQPAAVVIHSHRYGFRQTFRRYFDSVVAFRQLSARHGLGASAALGRGAARRELAFALRRRPAGLPAYALHLAAKAAGALAGHLADFMPRAWRARCSLQPGWWRGIGDLSP